MHLNPIHISQSTNGHKRTKAQGASFLKIYPRNGYLGIFLLGITLYEQRNEREHKQTEWSFYVNHERTGINYKIALVSGYHSCSQTVSNYKKTCKNQRGCWKWKETPYNNQVGGLTSVMSSISGEKWPLGYMWKSSFRKTRSLLCVRENQDGHKFNLNEVGIPDQTTTRRAREFLQARQ